MKHVFVFDPKAFYNQQWKMDNILDNIGQFFRTQEKPNFSIQFSRYRRNAIGIINEEAEKAEPGDIIRIYAVGGEEILFDCVNGVSFFPNMQIAAVPYGETNNFLKIFGDDKMEALRDIGALTQGKALPTDVIKWGVNYALNSCYIGMNSTVSKNLKDMRGQFNKSSFIIFSKLSAFLKIILTAFDRQISGRKYKIVIDDNDYTGNYSLIHIANGPYYAGKKTGAVNAVPNDGLLDVTLIKSSNTLNTLLSLRKYSRGKLPKNSVYVQAKKITIQSDSHMWIQLDNEYIQDTNISVDLMHNALQVVTLNDLSYPSAPALAK